jgi:hypothetical protein
LELLEQENFTEFMELFNEKNEKQQRCLVKLFICFPGFVDDDSIKDPLNIDIINFVLEKAEKIEIKDFKSFEEIIYDKIYLFYEKDSQSEGKNEIDFLNTEDLKNIYNEISEKTEKTVNYIVDEYGKETLSTICNILIKNKNFKDLFLQVPGLKYGDNDEIRTELNGIEEREDFDIEFDEKEKQFKKLKRKDYLKRLGYKYIDFLCESDENTINNFIDLLETIKNRDDKKQRELLEFLFRNKSVFNNFVNKEGEFKGKNWNDMIDNIESIIDFQKVSIFDGVGILSGLMVQSDIIEYSINNPVIRKGMIDNISYYYEKDRNLTDADTRNYNDINETEKLFKAFSDSLEGVGEEEKNKYNAILKKKQELQSTK